MLKRATKSVGIALIIILFLAIAINYFVRIAEDDSSTGIIMHWIQDILYSESYKNWETSAEYSSMAVDILIRNGQDIIENTPKIQKDREKAIEYLNIAINATRKIDDSYLRQSHILLPEAYREYEKSLRLFLLGLEENNLEHIQEAVPLYNQFLMFMESHKEEFRPIK